MSVENSYEAKLLRKVVIERLDLELNQFDEDFDRELETDLAVLSSQLIRSEIRPNLFSYQEDLSSQILHTIRARKRALLALPTGAGKTRTAGYAVLEGFRTGLIKRAIWLAPSIELLDQAEATIRKLWSEYPAVPDISIMRKPDSQTLLEGENQIFLTTPQSIHSSIKRNRPLPGNLDVVVFDEAHQLGAETYRAAVISLLGSSGRTPALIGLSATPGRVDGVETEELVKTFESNLLTSKDLGVDPVLKLQKLQILSRLEFRMIGPDWGAPSTEIDRLIASWKLIQGIALNAIRILVFTDSVAGAVVLSEMLNADNINSTYVHGELSESNRRKRIEDFADGRIHVLVNQRLLATGYDCPSISDLVVGCKVSSPIQFEQIVGRAARGLRTGGSEVSRIWQFDDHLSMHGLPKSYYRYKDYDWSS